MSLEKKGKKCTSLGQGLKTITAQYPRATTTMTNRSLALLGLSTYLMLSVHVAKIAGPCYSGMAFEYLNFCYWTDTRRDLRPAELSVFWHFQRGAMILAKTAKSR